MFLSDKAKVFLIVIAGLAATLIIIFAVVIGIAIASTHNLTGLDNFNESEAALPTQIFDRHGRLITEFFSDEKRELISIEELPRHLVYAVITREDHNFFEHKGISIRGTLRAALGYITRNFAGGGSTITQQLATMLYFDKSDISISRKLREMWVALQLERNWTKNEILEEYLNKSWFGHNTYGVEAASKFFFGHSTRELTIAESMMLALQLSSTTKYSPLKNPNQARQRQRTMLNEMVAFGYASQEEVDSSFEEFWQNYDYTRSGTTTAFFEREDKAPYFSEHIRYLLENEILLGSTNIYRDGYRVYTTLDLDYQNTAEKYLQAGIVSANKIYEANIAEQVNVAANTFLPFVNILSLGFDIDQLQIGLSRQQQVAKNTFNNDLVPLLDLLTLVNGNEDLREVIASSYEASDDKSKRTTVEGALISLENNTGRVLSMIGGSNFEQINQLNRALDARVQPGSSFKPLYYSAAIEKEVITPATMVYDSPVVFWNDDDTPYTPTNYRGEWQGPVLARYALAASMNVPSLRILNRLGFIDAIKTTSTLLGIPEKEQISRGFVRKYPIGLGVVSVSPIMMAQAFAVFPNQGRKVTPVFIRYIEDREGRIIAEPERDLREEQARDNKNQLLSPQTAYIMTDMLQTTVSEGTLRYPTNLVDGFDGMPIAGKTGTTQNWSALWTVGFTPYYTTAVWIGFDKGSNSLGVNQTGALTAGPIWARYMKEVHEELDAKEFVRPSSGLVEIEVTRRNGLLPPAGYQGATYTEIFHQGTEPTEFDESDVFQTEIAKLGILKLEQNLLTGVGSNTINFIPPDQQTEEFSSINLSLDLNLDGFNLELPVNFTEDQAFATNENQAFANELGNPLINDSNIDPDLIPPEGISGTDETNPYLD